MTTAREVAFLVSKELVCILALGTATASERFGASALSVGGAGGAEKFQTPEPQKPPPPPVENQQSGPLARRTADHSEFEALKGPFADAFEAAEAHVEKTIRSTWANTSPLTGQHLGKDIRPSASGRFR